MCTFCINTLQHTRFDHHYRMEASCASKYGEEYEASHMIIVKLAYANREMEFNAYIYTNRFTNFDALIQL
jgi:hypothetical protein